MVDGEQDHGFHELCLNHRSRNGDQWLAGEYRRTFRHCPNVTLELKMSEIVEECFGKAAASAQVFDIFFSKMQVFEIVDQLLNASHDGIAATIRDATEKHVKICAAIRDSFFKIAMCHGKFIKVGQHGQILVCHCENAPLRTYAVRFYSFFVSVLTQYIYRYHSTILEKVQVFL